MGLLPDTETVEIQNLALIYADKHAKPHIYFINRERLNVTINKEKNKWYQSTVKTHRLALDADNLMITDRIEQLISTY
jgi:hypothetical protein